MEILKLIIIYFFLILINKYIYEFKKNNFILKINLLNIKLNECT
jgi:hypothetical protein